MIERIRTGVICVHNAQVLAIELQDPDSREKFWSFPGGQVETGETPAQAAVRETQEETGYQVTLSSAPYVNHYIFHWNRIDYNCTTHWFKAELIDAEPHIVDDADYLLRAEWLDWPSSKALFDYHSALADAIDQLKT